MIKALGALKEFIESAKSTHGSVGKSNSPRQGEIITGSSTVGSMGFFFEILEEPL